MESEYKKDLSVNEAYKTAIQAIAAAIRRNSGTGDNINAVIIDKDGYRELSKEVKEAVQAVYWIILLLSRLLLFNLSTPTFIPK